MKKLIITIILLSSISFKSKAQITLEQCQQLAHENYPMIKQYELIEKLKEYNLSNASKSYLPAFSISGIASLVDGIPEFNVPGMPANKSEHHKFIGIAQINQTIWDGGITRSQKKQIKANADVEKQNIDVVLYSIKERVNQLYFGILLINEQIKQVDILDTNLKSTLKRVENALSNGIVYQSGVDAIKVEMLNSDQKRIQLNTQKEAYIKMLALMINNELSNKITFIIPDDTSLKNENEEINRPEIELYNKQKLLNETKNSYINSRIMPKIGLMGYAIGFTPNINIVNNKLDHLLMGGINISWNIGGLYNRKNDKNNIKIKNA